MELKVKIYLEDEQDKFMGIGVLWLLMNIQEKHSLKAAAEEMGISYTKAYSMINRLEEGLGQKILDRKKGGKNRSGAELTDFAKNFIPLYDEFQKNCKNILDKPFDKFKKNLDKLISESEKK